MCACRTKTALGIALADDAALNLGFHDTVKHLRQGKESGASSVMHANPHVGLAARELRLAKRYQAFTIKRFFFSAAITAMTSVASTSSDTSPTVTT